MQSLETMEKVTPEFQALTMEEKSRRREELSQILDTVLSGSTSLEMAQEIVSLALEMYLTGAISRKAKKPKPSKKRHGPRTTPIW